MLVPISELNFPLLQEKGSIHLTFEGGGHLKPIDDKLDDGDSGVNKMLMPVSEINSQLLHKGDAYLPILIDIPRMRGLIRNRGAFSGKNHDPISELSPSPIADRNLFEIQGPDKPYTGLDNDPDKPPHSHIFGTKKDPFY